RGAGSGARDCRARASRTYGSQEPNGMMRFLRIAKLQGGRMTKLALAAMLAILSAPLHFRADEPYARSRDYDLQHSKMVFRFDIEQKKVLGDVTHSLAILREGASKIAFDSVGLTIQGVSV